MFTALRLLHVFLQEVFIQNHICCAIGHISETAVPLSSRGPGRWCRLGLNARGYAVFLRGEVVTVTMATAVDKLSTPVSVCVIEPAREEAHARTW